MARRSTRLAMLQIRQLKRFETRVGVNRKYWQIAANLAVSNRG